MFQFKWRISHRQQSRASGRWNNARSCLPEPHALPMSTPGAPPVPAGGQTGISPDPSAASGSQAQFLRDLLGQGQRTSKSGWRGSGEELQALAGLCLGSRQVDGGPPCASPRVCKEDGNALTGTCGIRRGSLRKSLSQTAGVYANIAQNCSCDLPPDRTLAYACCMPCRRQEERLQVSSSVWLQSWF